MIRGCDAGRGGIRRSGTAALGLYLILTAGLCLAPGTARALDWDRLWLNADQRAAREMKDKHYTVAARTFHDKRWQAAAWYRAGQYKRSAEAWAQMDDVDAHYNRGNALARLGDLKGAAEEYRTVLKRDPGNVDARHNLEVVEKLMQHRNGSGSQQSRNPKEANRQQGKGRKGDQSSRGNAGGNSDSQRGDDQSRRQQASGKGQQGNRNQSSDRGNDRKHAHSEAANRSNAQSASTAQRGKQRDSTAGKTGDRGQNATAAAHTSSGSGTPQQQAAIEQWLRRIRDDPGGLLRRKFRYEYRQRQRGNERVEKPW